MKLLSCWLFCALLGISIMRFSLPVTAQEADIIIPPKPVNISLNKVAEFNCTGVASNFVWKRNGIEITHDGMGITISQLVINETQNILKSTMKETVSSLDSNGENITCTAVKLTPLSEDESKPALLLVQGILESVSNLTVTPIDSTTVLISWNPPFTLEGVPILGYNVTITNTLSGINKTLFIESDTMLHYNFNDHPDPETCNYTITVIPINDVGAGNTSTAAFFCIITTSQTSITEFSTSVFTTSSSLPPPSSTGANPGVIVGGILAVAVPIGVLALVLLFVYILYRRRHSSKEYNLPSRITHDATTETENEEETDLDESNESLQAVLTSLESANLIIRRSNVKFLNKIGNGNFGKVKKAKLKNSGKLVAVKTCDPSHSDAVKCQFLYEADILRHYKHPNIVVLIGVVANEKDPLRIVMEYVGWTFDYFLRANGHKCHVDKLTDMCKQVSDGMAYLERNRCVHRGLTARNCLVSSDHTVVKISNFGMSFGAVNIDPNDPKLRKVPIKWTAPEALKDDEYSSASDVWSFGILLWETFSRGKEPYPGIPNEAVRKKVKEGYRMDPPEDCPQTVFDLMNECWEYDPKDRPTFAKILSELKDIQTD